MFSVTNRIAIKAEHAERVDSLFQRNAELMKTCPGFVELRLLRPTDDPGARLVFVLWESQQAYEGYKKSEVFRQTHAGVDPTWFGGPPKVERFEVVYSL